MSETDAINIEDDPEFSIYWTAIPEAMRWVDGDPIGDPISVDEFRDAVERNTAQMDTGVEWDDEPRLSDVVGIIHTDGAEATASGLAMDLNAGVIYKHNEADIYIVGGANVNSESARWCFFPWALMVIGDDENDDDDYHSDKSVSDDAARWTPKLASDGN
jgi:hypothetical protein